MSIPEYLMVIRVVPIFEGDPCRPHYRLRMFGNLIALASMTTTRYLKAIRVGPIVYTH